MQPAEYDMSDDYPARSGLWRGILVIVTAVAVGLFVITQGLDEPRIEAGASADGAGPDDGGEGDAEAEGAGADAGAGLGSAASTTTIVVETTTTETVAETTTTEVGPVVRAPADTPVLVLNAEGTKGIAGQGADLLQGLGYAVLAPKNANSLGPSQILYQDSFEAEARGVAEALAVDPAVVVAPLDPAAPPFDDLGNAVVIVIIGQDGVIGV
jgi:hypothetical protein